MRRSCTGQGAETLTACRVRIISETRGAFMPKRSWSGYRDKCAALISLSQVRTLVPYSFPCQKCLVRQARNTCLPTPPLQPGSIANGQHLNLKLSTTPSTSTPTPTFPAPLTSNCPPAFACTTCAVELVVSAYQQIPFSRVAKPYCPACRPLRSSMTS